jgi:hypothetical protein
MADQQSSILVGVFQNMAQAKQAYDDLSRTGYGDDYLGFADPSAGSSGLAKNLAQAGVPDEDSQFYKREFQAGHPIVTLRVGGLQEEAIQKARNILKNNAAYDAISGRNQDEFGSNVKTDERTPFFDVASGTGESQEF